MGHSRELSIGRRKPLVDSGGDKTTSTVRFEGESLGAGFFSKIHRFALWFFQRSSLSAKGKYGRRSTARLGNASVYFVEFCGILKEVLEELSHLVAYSVLGNATEGTCGR